MGYSNYASIRDAIKSIFETVTGAKCIEKDLYENISDLSQFYTGNRVKVSFIRRIRLRAERWSNLYYEEAETFEVHYLEAYQDGKEAEFQNILDSIISSIENNPTLNGLVLDTSPVNVEVDFFDWGGIVCRRAIFTIETKEGI